MRHTSPRFHHFVFPPPQFSRHALQIGGTTKIESTCMLCGHVIVGSCYADGGAGIETEEAEHVLKCKQSAIA